MKLKLIPKECEAVIWTGNNFKEVKDFCKEFCTITYESCEIDDYWLLKVYDMFRGDMVVVPNGDYIVKMKDEFVVVNDFELHNWFTISEKENTEPKCRICRDCSLRKEIDNHTQYIDTCPYRTAGTFGSWNEACEHFVEKS